MLRRSVTYLLASLLLTPVLVGCSLFGKKKADSSATDAYMSDWGGSTNAGQTPGGYDDPYAATLSSSTTADSSYDSASGGARYHTVGKKDTLYSLARKYYNDQRRWKDIYNANQDAIGDPNKIYVGQRLLIP